MFSEVLRRSNARLAGLQCCKHDGSPCDCLSSLHEDYTGRLDSYNCEKKLSTYVLRYGPYYASEIFHYLTVSNFRERIDLTRPLRVLSLGCGFSPDYFAIRKYLEANNIPLQVDYVGIDNSTCWTPLRPNVNECRYIQADITTPIPQFPADVVVVSKVFSTLYRNSAVAADAFLINLKQAVVNTLPQNTTLIFVDINLRQFGRDIFHRNVSAYMPHFAQYYFDGYTGNNWTRIMQNELVFDIPDDLSVDPLTSVRSTVVFEYRK